MKKSSKHEALEEKMKKVHSSTEYCAKCGKKVSKTERHESGHREYEHEHNSITK